MGRPKGGKNKYWSKEEKLRIINLMLNDGLSTEQAAKQEDISGGMLSKEMILTKIWLILKLKRI